MFVRSIIIELNAVSIRIFKGLIIKSYSHCIEGGS